MAVQKKQPVGTFFRNTSALGTGLCANPNGNRTATTPSIHRLSATRTHRATGGGGLNADTGIIA
jgi:hypothetical protein